MGMQNPQVNEPVDKFADVIGENKPFTLLGIRTVKVTTANYGEGEMVIMRVAEHPRELSIWGAYLIAQAHAAEPSDFNKRYQVVRRTIAGFGRNGSPVKVIDPVA